MGWFKRHTGGQAAEDFGIAKGQRFRSLAARTIVWEVGAIYRYPWEPTPHVRLQRVGVPGDMKTIALETLRDQRYFEPAG